MTKHTGQWDHSTPEQRAHRKHLVSGRGEVNPSNGKVENPNNVTGVRFLGTVEQLARDGFLEPRHMDAADDFSRLCRANRGSPSSQDCTAAMMQGYVDGGAHDDAGPSLQDQRDWRDLKARLGKFQRAELERTLWESDQGFTARPDLLRAGLEVVAGFFGR